MKEGHWFYSQATRQRICLLLFLGISHRIFVGKFIRQLSFYTILGSTIYKPAGHQFLADVYFGRSSATACYWPLLASTEVDHQPPLAGQVQELDEEVTPLLDPGCRHVEDPEQDRVFVGKSHLLLSMPIWIVPWNFDTQFIRRFVAKENLHICLKYKICIRYSVSRDTILIYRSSKKHSAELSPPLCCCYHPLPKLSFVSTVWHSALHGLQHWSMDLLCSRATLQNISPWGGPRVSEQLYCVNCKS